MKKLLLLLILIIACVSVAASPQLLDDRWERAYQTWDGGDYITALRAFDALLKGQDADRWMDRIALVTGELYRDTELTTDGKAPRFSPSGRYACYETGSRPSVVTHIINTEGEPFKVADIQGENLVFSPTRDTVAFLRLKESPDITSLRKEIEDLTKAASQDRQILTARQRRCKSWPHSTMT